MENKRDKIYKVTMLIIITTIVTFMVTSIGMYNYFTNTDDGQIHTLVKYIEVSKNAETLAEKVEVVKRYLEKYYIGEIDNENMTEDAIKGFVDGLGDDYTQYLTKNEYEDMLVNITGDYVGIGIYMYQDNNGNIVVLAPIEGSPAEEAGLQMEDIIVSIDGESTADMDMDDAATKIKGKEGTTVKLEILRGNEKFEKTITRRKVVIADSTSEILDGNIGYIQLITFDENGTDNITKYISDFQSKGVKSVILDFRDNAGGIVDEAISISELFLKKDNIIMRSYNKTDKETVIKSKNKKPIEMEIVILVNENSASATEIVTAALQENNVATVVGTKSYGKGIMQELMPLFEGALKVTVEEFKTPEGNKIHGEGITPDVIIEDDIKTEEDEQLQKAIELLEQGE